MNNNNNDGFCVAVCLAILLLGAMFTMPPITEPEDTTAIEDEQDVSVFIALRPYFGQWIDYNNTISIFADGRNEYGDCIDGWFLTSYKYERGTSYIVYINDTVVKKDWISFVGDFATWQGESWWGYIGESVVVCHINLTLSEMI